MPTVGELKERYWPLVLSKISPGTGRAYNSAWRTRVAPSFADCDVSEITTLVIEAELARWTGAVSTRIDALACLSAIFRVAVKGGFVTVNPCVGVERPRNQDSDPTSRSLSLHEVERLIAVLPRSGPYRRFVLAMLYTGCRLGEVAGLRVSDVNVSERTISVRRTASAGLSGELLIGPTKGRRVRLVPLPDPMVPLVREASDNKGNYDLLFPGPRGGHINSGNLSRALNWPEIRAFVKEFPPDEEPLHFHDLRHTAAVMLFRAGVSAPDVQAMMGHSTLAVTQLYANTRHDAARRGASALSALWSDSNTQSEAR